MKNIFYLLILLLYSEVKAQSSDQNYIKILKYRQETTTSDASKAKVTVTYHDGLGRPIQKVEGSMSGNGKDLITPLTYDAFGRQPKDYLPYESSGIDISYDASALSSVLTFYNKPIFENTTNPFNEKFFENSPLGRLNKVAAPGNQWLGNLSDNNDNTVKFSYLTNISDEVKFFRAVATWNASSRVYTTSINEGGTYAAGELYRTITSDANRKGNINTTVGFNPGQMEEFKDSWGKTILKRSYYLTTDNFGMPGQVFINLYYIYDQFDNLAYIVPLNVLTSITQNYLDQYSYQYRYDARNRLVEKKLPGKEWEYTVYNEHDQPVATGPVYSPFGAVGNTQKGWLVTKYDGLGRVAYTGWLPTSTISSISRSAYQNNAFPPVNKTTSANTVDNVQINYSNVGYPTSSMKLLSVNYYDNYNFPLSTTFPSLGVEGESVINDARGLITGSWSRIVTTATQTFAEVKTIFYNSKSRTIRQRITNTQLGGYIEEDTKYTFEGSPIFVLQKCKRSNSSAEQEIVVRTDYLYTAQDRLLSENHTIGNRPMELIKYNAYNSIGQLIQKKIGRSQVSPLQVVDFTYNIRGWLKGINNTGNLAGLLGTPTDLFALKLNYTDPASHILVPSNYNGNITEIFWRTSSDNILRKYCYTYDQLSRFKEAYYQMPNAVEPVRGSYNESVKYDHLGNILNLRRTGGTDDENPIQIDNLTYNYSGNRLIKVVDASNSPQGFNDNTPLNTNDFSYDDFGNLTSDLNKGIQSNGIIYNHQNQPLKITINNGVQIGNITYVYNADGEKLRKTVVNNSVFPSKTTTTEYFGGFQYTNGVLDFLSTSEGYIKNTMIEGINHYNYVYNYLDHLNNVRVSYMLDPSDNKVKIMEENHYYPFGLKHEGYSSEQLMVQPGLGTSRPIILTPVVSQDELTYKFKFQSQERQDELKLNWDNFKWRNYDYALGRFMNLDPLAEKFSYQSPYNFSENKVVNSRELEGLESVSAITFGREQVWGTAFKRSYKGSNHYNVPSGPGEGSFKELSPKLIAASNSDNKGIGFLGIFSHGDFDSNESRSTYGQGMIFANAELNSTADNVYQSDLGTLTTMISNGELKFAEGAVIYLGACNAGTLDANGNSFAQTLADATGVTVVAVTDAHMAALDPNNGNNTTFYPLEEGGQLMIYTPNQDPVPYGDGSNVNVTELAKETIDNIKKKEDEKNKQSDNQNQGQN